MTDVSHRSEPAVPPGLRLYAIGDVHGRADLLDTLLTAIAADAARRPALAKRIVFLGDYVDRGPRSKEVIDLVLDAAPRGAELVTLMGNHEEMMHRFLRDISVGRSWMLNGGDATLESYGVDAPRMLSSTAQYRQAQAEFDALLPERHLRFLQGLAVTHVAGDYLFVHAGLRPGVPIDRQEQDDLIWIREEFLHSEADFGKVVVHGHSIAREPVLRPNRIGIDTGAYASGRLTCLVLEGTAREFLST
jgi:serine/threonine protein phosphatase 1